MMIMMLYDDDNDDDDDDVNAEYADYDSFSRCSCWCHQTNTTSS